MDGRERRGKKWVLKRMQHGLASTCSQCIVKCSDFRGQGDQMAFLPMLKPFAFEKCHDVLVFQTSTGLYNDRTTEAGVLEK